MGVKVEVCPLYLPNAGKTEADVDFLLKNINTTRIKEITH